ncbi:MAG: D-3-phosphoglycerate dehydrogenase / 2-oxoglutarate reductase [Candidatus Sumerlaeota bacterium]|nr:D-3-phosphoglycerate dehydrogenase / 2-oxoglutarate reductase [Candidatus Sumerlaeota bacterium]
MTYKILVSDKLSEDGLEVLRKAGFEVDHLPEITQEEIRECIAKYHAWVIRSRSKATAEILEKAENLKVVGRAGVGVDNVDIDAASKRGIIVMNTPGGNTISTAEHAISMMMALARKIPAADASMKAGKWDKKSFMGAELRGKTLGVFGLGRIGQEVCKRMRAFDMSILAYDPFVSTEAMKHLGVETASIDEICRRADFITIHTPMSPETKKMINAERLAMMKKTCRVVNCARGGIVDEAALADALKNGTIAGAALDVFEHEPIGADHPLMGLTNAVLTPHIAASTVEAQENVAIQVAEQILDVLLNSKITNAVNAPSIDPKILDSLKPFLRLAEKLGAFAAQFSQGRPKRLTCRYSGSVLEYPLQPLTTAFAKGFLQTTTDRPINYVNALPILAERGIEILETRSSSQFRYRNLLTLAVETEDGVEDIFAGTVFEPDHGRIVMVNDKSFVAHPEGNLVVVENEDVPGVIGQVGTFFGKESINIAEMTWGRVEDGAGKGHAMTIINIEGPITSGQLAELRKLPNIKSARLIRL